MTKLKGTTIVQKEQYGRPTRSVIPSTSDLNTALNDVEDLLQRALTPFILLGQIAKDINEQKDLSGDKVVVGVLKKYLTKEALSTIMTYMGHMMQGHDWGYSYDVGDIEVQVRIIKRKYAVLQHPETKWHKASDYYIPNPFETYWKMKGLIR